VFPVLIVLSNDCCFVDALTHFCYHCSVFPVLLLMFCVSLIFRVSLCLYILIAICLDLCFAWIIFSLVVMYVSFSFFLLLLFGFLASAYLLFVWIFGICIPAFRCIFLIKTAELRSSPLLFPATACKARQGNRSICNTYLWPFFESNKWIASVLL